ncbi:hypothetical protein [Thermophagus xiamenensis]|uniref:Uncharacterized protein n=1 Tax=Thermophagus xiamenensis TaxID=385682 RepID=A0A1I1VIJ8_9BACT|nr:hypothetical protein [Thermophagus xiamenensis]SFD82625.1 hypothetical protein SAMN05444380_102194 [Thermophagus xiamenensis]
MIKDEDKCKKHVIGSILRFMEPGLTPMLVLCSLLMPALMHAQEEQAVSERFDLHLDVKNMHLWHGGVVTPGAMFASAIEYKSTNQKFTAGLWGGAGFSGDYKEFSYYAHYRFKPNFRVSLISHNNYSNSEEVNIFSYDKYTSPNFVDVVLEYTLSEQTPLTVYWSTILFGNGGDFEVNNDGSVSDSYSTYAELRYLLFPMQKTQVMLFLGGAFSLTTEKTFYSDSANITAFGLTLQRDVEILSGNFPVSATALWNPETKVGALQLGISLF